MSPEELIKAGPSTEGNKPAERLTELFQNEVGFEKPIPIDTFDKVKEGLDPKIEEEIKKEEEKAKKLDEKSKADDSKTVEVKEEDKQVDLKLPVKSEDKTEEKTEDKSVGGLEHLELGISPGAAIHFKNMNKQAREWVTSELKTRLQKNMELTAKLKEAENKRVSAADGNNLPDAWYEHPQAVSLLPDYQIAINAKNKLHQAITHLEDQLIKVGEGENWEDIDFDDKGNFVTKGYKPTESARIHIGRKIREYSQYVQNLDARANQIQTNFQTNAVRSKEQVTQLENQYFPQYNDPEKLKTNDNYKAIQTALGKFGLSNDRLSGVLSKMYLYTMDTLTESESKDAKIKELEEKLAKVGVSKEGNKNGPTGDEINKGAAKAGKVYANKDEEPIEMDIFDKIKDGVL